jgi:hypothetical protein
MNRRRQFGHYFAKEHRSEAPTPCFMPINLAAQRTCAPTGFIVRLDLEKTDASLLLDRCKQNKCLSETSTIRLGHFSAKSRLCGSEHLTKLLTSLKVQIRIISIYMCAVNN